MKTGIYQIRNIINNAIYVGSAAGQYGFHKRWNSHRSALNNNSHHSLILQRAWNKYGINVFMFEIIEECEPRRCLEREQYYLELLAPKYNIAQCAQAPMAGRQHSQETKDRIRQAQRGKVFSKQHRTKIGEANKKRRGENHPRVKLTKMDILAIRKLLVEGIVQRIIAKQFRVSPITISRIKTGYNWNHIK